MLQVASTEYNAPEVLFDALVQSVRTGHWQMNLFGRMRIDPVSVNPVAIPKQASTRGAECFDGKDLALFHLGLVLILDEWNLLAAMDAILFDIVGAEAADGFHRVGLVGYGHFVGLHSFLDGSADVAYTDVDPGSL